jgi:hypothetical protein
VVASEFVAPESRRPDGETLFDRPESKLGINNYMFKSEEFYSTPKLIWTVKFVKVRSTATEIEEYLDLRGNIGIVKAKSLILEAVLAAEKTGTNSGFLLSICSIVHLLPWSNLPDVGEHPLPIFC